MCRIPCWPTPSEALAIIQAGYGDRLRMTARYEDLKHHDTTVYLLAPRADSPETSSSPYCCILMRAGLCILHDLGLKPIEGRAAHHDRVKATSYTMNHDIRNDILKLWDSDFGAAVIEYWERR